MKRPVTASQYALLDAYCIGDTDMACIAPISVPVVKADRRYLERVRCGQCHACRLHHKLAWTGRMMLELQEAAGIGRFLTLSYKDDPGQLDYRDFQLFMKRYRKSYGPCRFFAVGEYGERTHRGHWHAIIFGHQQVYRGHALLPEWNLGFSGDGQASFDSIGYVAGYVLKKDELGRPPIVRASNRPGIGLRWVRDMACRAAEMHKDQALACWPGSYRLAVKGKSKRFPLTKGGLEAFRSEYLKAGGLPPREDDPDEKHLLNLYYTQGDPFFEERSKRAAFVRIERGLDGTAKTARGFI